jgi:hypothetical protein
MTIEIPRGLIDKYYEAADLFINSDIIGRKCTLIYPPKREQCTNCVIKPVGASSTNIYRNGGPMPFTFGGCPLCGGNGYKESEVFDYIRLRIYWNRADWITKGKVLNIEDAEVMAIGFMSDLPKLLRAIEIVLITNQEPKHRMVLTGKPHPHGFGRNRYFVAYMKGI